MVNCHNPGAKFNFSRKNAPVRRRTPDIGAPETAETVPDMNRAAITPAQMIALAEHLSDFAHALASLAERQRQRNQSLARARDANRKYRARRREAIDMLIDGYRRAIPAAALHRAIARHLEMSIETVEDIDAACRTKRVRQSRERRDREIMALARRGWRNTEIATHLGIHRNTVSAAIRRALDSNPPPAARIFPERRSPAE